MTLAELNKICKDNNIPEDVRLLSDSGWECCETEMDGVWYSEIDNAIVFTQESEENDIMNKGYIVGNEEVILSPNQKLRRLK